MKVRDVDAVIRGENRGGFLRKGPSGPDDRVVETAEKRSGIRRWDVDLFRIDSI